MKKLVVLLILCSSTVFAQRIHKQSLKGIKTVRIESHVNIKVVTGNTSELILLEANKNRNDHFPAVFKNNKKKDRKAGLKAIYAGGTDNTDGLGFSITKEGSVLVVRDLKSHMQREEIKVTLPKTMNINIDSGTLGSIFIDGFTSEVEADSNVGEITLKT